MSLDFIDAFDKEKHGTLQARSTQLTPPKIKKYTTF